MADHSKMKLGKRAADLDAPRIMLNPYLRAMPPVPPQADQTVDPQRGRYTDWGMLANDTLGDCTIAAVGHAVQLYCHRGWGNVTVTDVETIGYYSKWAGYVPGDPNTDNGAVEIDILNQWLAQGFNGHKLLAFADLQLGATTTEMLRVMQAIAFFGCIYIGAELPLAFQNADVWDNFPGQDGEPGSWGGHAVICPIYNATGPVCITWGELKQWTWAGFFRYVSEVHVPLIHGWYPVGFSMDQLVADLQALKS